MQSKDSVFQTKVNVATGAASGVDVAIAGITTIDTLVSVVGLDHDAANGPASVVDLSAHYSIPSDGQIESDQDDSAYQLIVTWIDRTAG